MKVAIACVLALLSSSIGYFNLGAGTSAPQTQAPGQVAPVASPAGTPDAAQDYAEPPAQPLAWDDGGAADGERTPPIVPGANDGSPGCGTDGVFDPNANIVIDLRLAAYGLDPNGVPYEWDSVSPVPGRGIYDPNKWAVVFKYSSVNVGSGKTVSFINHPSGAPVVWLVQGNVTIAGTVSVNGQDRMDNGEYAVGGPGGFRGSMPFVVEIANGSARYATFSRVPFAWASNAARSRGKC